jgi:hypothetical protein
MIDRNNSTNVTLTGSKAIVAKKIKSAAPSARTRFM